MPKYVLVFGLVALFASPDPSVAEEKRVTIVDNQVTPYEVGGFMVQNTKDKDDVFMADRDTRDFQFPIYDKDGKKIKEPGAVVLKRGDEFIIELGEKTTNGFYIKSIRLTK